MTGWIITAAVFAFILLILFTSIKCRLSYHGEELRVQAGFWCFWFTVVPPKEKKRKKKPKKEKKLPAEKTDSENVKKKPKQELGREFVLNLIRAGIKGGRVVFGHLVIYNLALRIVVGDEDAAECALQYGKLCGYIYGGLAAFKNLIYLREKEVSLSCDFAKNKTEYDIDAAVRIRVLFVFGAAFRMLFHIVVNTMKNNSDK